MATKQKHIITGKDRTVAQIALATVGEATRPCPDVAELALLVDGRNLSESKQEELWEHLASCPSCYEQWRIISEVQTCVVKKRSVAKIITLGGGFLAAAASIMLFVHIQYSSIPEVVVLDEVTAPMVQKAVGEDEVASSSDRYLFDSNAVISEEVEALQVEEVEHQRAHTKKKSRAMVRQPVYASPPMQCASQQPGISAEDKEDSFSVLDTKEGIGEIVLEINRVIPTVLQKLKQAEIGSIIEVKTYKRDRGFSIKKQDEDQFLLREYGYRDHETTVSLRKLKKYLKIVLKKEFPRSNKVWLKANQ